MNDMRYIYINEKYEKVAIDIKKDNLKYFISEFELMNPFEIKNTFKAYFLWDDKTTDFPTPTRFTTYGNGWGSGNGMGLIYL